MFTEKIFLCFQCMCIYRAQDKDRWWALVNVVKNLRVP